MFTSIFLAFLSVSLILRLTLAWRQTRYVAQHRAAVPSAFAEHISLSAHQRAADYTCEKTRFGRYSLLFETLILLGFTLGGGLQTLHHFWSAQSNHPLIYGVAMIFSVVLISGLFDLPFSWYAQFVIEEKYGFNRMSRKLFISDLIKQLMLSLVIGTPVLLAVLWLMDAMGEFWWLYVGVFWCTFNLLILFAYPRWIAPLFNTFSPLTEGELKTRIETLLTRCGFALSGIFVMDGSKRSGHGNAYFTGFGKTKRIVFFDTLLKRLAPAEVEAVLAHELGHFRKNHVIKRITLIFAASFAFLFILAQCKEAAWFYHGLGVSAQNTALALILFFLVMPTFSFLLTPLMSALSRQHEYEADRYAAQHAAANELISALVRLYEDNASTLTPDPLHSLFYDSHPPASLRIQHLSSL